MGEKFSANPVTGTGSMSVPIFTSPGRSGVGPQLSLSYDSGAGNGPFGWGWSLSVPSITRKTDKGLPRYGDAEKSDVFILSGAEDLVPALKVVNGGWKDDVVPSRKIGTQDYEVRRYRPRTEGLFARIERWSNKDNPEDTFWRSISKDNITTWYGKTTESRIADPEDPSRVFSWLICESHDDKGNAIVYGYKEEDSENIDLSQAHEHNRTDHTRKANRYLKRIRYGNRVPYLPELLENKPWPAPPGATAPDGSAHWLFEVVFDYGEHDPDRPMPEEPTKKWPCRIDPFSSYRAGFEVRTYRLCQRVLMFHHFPGEPEVGANSLGRSTDFTYSYEINPSDLRNPVFSFLLSATQSGYKAKAEGSHLKKSLPPLQFEYSAASVQEDVRELDADSLENLPVSLDGATYQWVDLDGEGVSGILSRQAGGWFYKHNLSPLPTEGDGLQVTTTASFAPIEQASLQPSLAGAGQQFLDLAGDGQVDLVQFGPPLSGYYERTQDGEWSPFVPFESAPSLAWDDPNLKFADLTGDGHADILITQDDVFTWHPSLAEAGFGPAEWVRQPLDEEEGPRLVFADGTQSIHLADFSGDGLTDLVRLRNGEVCYWPNLGYGRFGAKVTMDNAPWFDAPDLFDQRRIQLADIDGSGVTDIIYLRDDGVQLYFNQSGNSWSEARVLTQFPRIDNLSSVTALDLLGNGTACLVWSSPLPADAPRSMRYVDLMGGQKPHLLVRVVNNLGAETRVEYAPSTRFYLADKMAGKLWITKLPFPVHCVEKVTVSDKWRKTSFSTTYSYHHGYFDGVEREFRGFGRVEQLDVESFGEFAEGNTTSPYITDKRELYQPPVKTITWYHTGASIDSERILSSFRDEYFPNWFEALDPSRTNFLGSFRENDLPEPDLDADELSAQEWQEALRACKGMTLRQEIYELDVDTIELGEHRPVKLFSTAYHNCHIRRLQPRIENRHAVFLVTESEAITYNYELDLRQDKLTPDPRIAHTLNLRVDEYGNVLQSVAAVYPRVDRYSDETLSATERGLIDRVQQETHLAYTENRYTNDFPPDMDMDQDSYRLRVPCEVLTCELTGISPRDEEDSKTPDPWDDFYFTLDELRHYNLSEVHPTSGEKVTDIPYHKLPTRTAPEKRLVEHVRMLFFKEDLSGPLPFRQLGRLGLPYETYKLALTGDLIGKVFGNKLTADVRSKLAASSISGYLSGATLANRFEELDTTGQYWIRSGIAGFAADAADHFYIPERYTDAFGNVTTLQFDNTYDLFIQSSTDPAQNTVRVEKFDFRVLAPQAMRDINGNLSEVYFDILGMPAATALKGKGTEGDNLSGFDDALANLDLDTLLKLFTADYDETEARRLLGNATVRHVYHFGQTRAANGSVIWGSHPPCACGILRERHVAKLAAGEQSPIQTGFEYSDGLSVVLVKKAQAEPAPGETNLRWITSGRTILNNKGKPVKQYEPYFSESSHRFEEPREVGVTPVMYYDSAGRLVRTELPDGSFSRVEFSPWHVATYDANDSVIQSQWYIDRGSPDPITQPEPTNNPRRRAAWLAAKHADTPAVQILDSLGREVIGIAHNRYEDSSGTLRVEKYLTYTKLDAEGKPLWIRDARRNLVMQYIRPAMLDSQTTDSTSGFVPSYDIAGNLLFQHSMDAGDRWMLPDAAGKPMFAWDFNQRQEDNGLVIDEKRLFFTRYDALHRPLEQWLAINGGSSQLVERYAYGEQLTNVSDARARNLRGQLYQHYDPSGLNHVERLDFKGNPRELRRILASHYTAPVIDWQAGSATAQLETETFVQITEYDALNRMTRLYNWHRGTGSRVAVYEPRYNARGLLESEGMVVRATKTATGYAPAAGHPRVQAIEEIAYNAKGQKELVRYGNGTFTRYDYDPESFRLIQLRTSRPGFDPAFPNPASSLQDARVLQNLHYVYDPVGNITEIRDDAYEPAFFSNQKVDAVSRYTYDAIYRLIRATGRENYQASGAPGQFEAPPFMVQFPVTDPNTLRNYTQSYTYDPVGNILQMRHVAKGGSWTRHYEYATDSNRLLRTWEGNNTAGATKYRYDAHGNILNLANVAAAQSIRWDYRDTIRALNLQGGGRAYYNNDAGKQRTRKVIESQTGAKQRERIYLGGLEIYRRYSGSNLVEEIESLHLFEGEQRLLLIDDVLQTENVLYRYQYNYHLGSACLELDEQSGIIAYEEYHPFGTSAYRAMRVGVEVSAKRYRYTGKERDEESGLYHHGARYYAPWLGRWTACDPAGMVDGVNVCCYARNNPVNLRDGNGLQSGRGKEEEKPHDFIGSYVRFAEAYTTKSMELAVEDVVGPVLALHEVLTFKRRFTITMSEEEKKRLAREFWKQSKAPWQKLSTALEKNDPEMTGEALAEVSWQAMHVAQAVAGIRKGLTSLDTTPVGRPVRPVKEPVKGPATTPVWRPVKQRVKEPVSGPAAPPRHSEITTLTNVKADIAAADVIPQYNPGSGFSGAYNPATGQWVALASGEATTLTSGKPVQTVPLLGGHAAAEGALVERTGITDTSGNVGFALVWEGNNTVRLRWNSTTINTRNFGDRAAPATYRAEIRQAVERDTGFKVIE
jgi:RHS repeat-associated protein